MDGRYSLELNESSSLELRRTDDGSGKHIDMAACYGTRLERLTAPADANGRTFESICEELEKYQITCDELVVFDGFPTVEETVAFVELLKPVHLKLSCCNEQMTAIHRITVLSNSNNCKTLVRL